MGCMPGWTWNVTALKCDLDLVSASADVATPDDDHYLQYMPKTTLPPPKTYLSGAKTNVASRMMGFADTNRQAQDDAYMNAHKDQIAAANKNAAEAIANGDPDARELMAP